MAAQRNRSRPRQAARVAWPSWASAEPVSRALLPLRLFLGFVFCYAGISKIADRRFLDSSSVVSMHSQLLAVRSGSPIGGLLVPVVDHSFAFGVLMAFAELAVGLGVLAGLLTRVAAVGGMLLSLSLWLTISWQAVPWYTSADLVYLVALSSLAVAGAGQWSLDAWLTETSQRRPDPATDRARRAFVVAGGALLGAAVLGTSALFRRGGGAPTAGPPVVPPTAGPPTRSAPGPSPSSGSRSAGPSSPSGPSLVSTAEVPVGGAKQVDDAGTPVWVMQLSAGRFSAVTATCPHQGCLVEFQSASDGFTCPCHGSRFAADGALRNGPAASGLDAVPVAVSNGTVRATS